MPDNETGIAINIFNFKAIIEKCVTFGSDYNPSNNAISIAKMTLSWTTVSTEQSDFLTCLEAIKIPITDRELLFDKLNKVIVRSVNFYGSTDANKLRIRDAKALQKVIAGSKGKKAVTKETQSVTKNISNSHKSFVQKTDNFEKLVKLFGNDTVNYNPNEDLIKLVNLQAMLDSLVAANNAMTSLIAQIDIHRSARDFGLYEEKTGLVDLSLACKKYVRSLYGPKSPQTKMVTSIYLRRFKKLSTNLTT